MTDASAITAVLGPTNTGKTHRAVERMLSYPTGMIGLPLRLLAREVYDRVTARIGEARVALVTGEEKRIPRRPDYWVCTVEAMPIGREVDFLAIDEVQLAAHDQRGHVFTDRILHARGRRETWFMGADTMRPLLRELTPTARFVEHPRLSRLTAHGATKLARLPSRSAVVAFSTLQVYETAERLRALRGGAAVVLGALSPRTRNAQVAMYQAGEVDHLVATDAIGMGLNLDVKHVAFAALRKFDGKEARDLETPEVAQIAGRAGRYLDDGTFGTVAPLALPAAVAAAVEAHRFPAVRRVRWRNSDLDMSSIDALLASLRQRPRARYLVLADGAEDSTALQLVARDPEVRSRARGPDAVALLWEVCRVPDYRKLLAETHAALLVEIWRQLSGPRAALDEAWLETRVREADEVTGDIDALLGRIASVRTWTYAANHGGWVDDRAGWQERTRAVEDRLSDALHDRLVQRFVERRGRRVTMAARPPAARRATSPVETRAPVAAAGHPFAALSALRARLPSAPVPTEEPSLEDWVEELVGAEHAAFAIDDTGRIAYAGVPVGQLARGVGLLAPEVRLVGLEEVGAGARLRIQRRLQAFSRDLVSELLAPLRAAARAELGPAARGVLYQLEQGLGSVPARDATVQLQALTPRERSALASAGVELGSSVLHLPALLSPGAVAQRLALCRAYFEDAQRLAAPCAKAASLRVARGVEPRTYAAIGYPLFGGRAVRADVAERAYRASRDGDAEVDAKLARKVGRLLGCSPREAIAVIEAMRDGPAAAAG
jgi:ATP-dependent RNA helicase SUPV3L1/SUV3